MKKLIIITLILFFKVSYSQQINSENAISLFQQAIQNKSFKFYEDDKEKFSTLDSIVQVRILNYLFSYADEPVLYNNIHNISKLLSLFYYSEYNQLRQKATCLILDLYRIQLGNSYSDLVWYENARISDFNIEAKKKIMKIIKCEPFSDLEKELIYKYEYNLQHNSFLSDDTSRVRNVYAIESELSISELIDSLSNDLAKSHVNNLVPKMSIDDNFYFLPSWLYMYEAKPYIETAELSVDSSYYKYFKLALARLGNKEYEKQILNNMYESKYFDYYAIAFLCSNSAVDAIIASLKIKRKPGVSEFYVDSETGFVVIDSDYCSYLQSLIFGKYIPELPYNFSKKKLLSCEISDEEIESIIKWLEENKYKNIMNTDFH